MNKSDLLNKIREGDDAVFRQLYVEFRGEFVQWIMQGSQLDEEAAAEIFQDSMVAVYANAADGKLTELNSTFKTYLFGIGKNKVLEYKRNWHHEAASGDGDAYQQAFAQEEDYGIADDEIAELQRALKKLGDACRQLLELYYFNKLDQDTISTVLGYKDRNTVKTKKYKCLARLRQIMLKTPSP